MTDNTAHGLDIEGSQKDEDKEQSFITMKQENGQKILVQFAKTFIELLESTVFSNTDSEDVMDEEAEEFFDNFGNDKNSSATISAAALLVSDEDFAFEKYFPSDKRQEFRSLFIDVAFDIFRSYEYQLIMLVREERKISEIAEDIVHRILDVFKESQRGFNPEYIRPEITRQYLIEKALHHSEPEGIIYNSEWSAVEILENPGILIRNEDQKEDHRRSNFYQSHWQKNFLPYRKKIGSKYGFRLKFDFETEESILRNFEKVPNSSVSPLYLNYQYRLDPEVAEFCKDKLLKELEDGSSGTAEGNEKEVKKTFQDKVKEFQMKLLIQKQEEDKNSDKVMKQIANLSQRFENLQNKLVKLEQKGIISGVEEVNKAKSSLLRSNYHVRFEVRDPSSDFDFGKL